MTAPRLKPWMLVSAIWLWPAIFGVVDRLVQGRLHGWDPASAAELLFQFWDWVAYALVTPAIFWASARWPVVGERLRRHFAIHLGFALLFCVVWAVIGKLLQLVLGVLLEPDTLRQAIADAGPNLGLAVAKNVASWIATTLPFGVVVYTTVAALAHAIGYFAQARDRELQLARLSEQLAEARLGALQAQVNPHFLFNTLNTLVVLVRDGDRAGAVRIIELMSEVFRRTLRRDPCDECALGDELSLVRQYLAIEEARFPDRLRVMFDVAPGLEEAAIPSFALQHLVENAIRHGIARREDAGQVWITIAREGDQLVMTVADDGIGVTPGGPPNITGHGIANTRERLSALYGQEAFLTVEPRSEGGTVATLRIPHRQVAPEGSDAGR
jgi:two-component system, LytTR family, sensor kinase